MTEPMQEPTPNPEAQAMYNLALEGVTRDAKIIGGLALEVERLREQLAHAQGECARLHRLLRRPKVWAAHAAEPDVVAPECDCVAGAVCQRAGCCYLGETVPSNVRDTLEPGQ
jgi:hypothetical protein